jgi:hypothetical protein
MTDETFKALLGVSPAEYAARGWSVNRLVADLRERGQASGQRSLDLAYECAAHLDLAGLPMCVHPSANLHAWWEETPSGRVLSVKCLACGALLLGGAEQQEEK